MPGPVNQKRFHLTTILTIAISLVWLINGLFCKLLNLVSRHQQIVARIIGDEYSTLFTKLIGAAEVIMFIWIVSKRRSRLCSITQIIVIAAMNMIEFILAPDLLLFGRMNLVFATLLIVVIFINEFVLQATSKNLTKSSS